MALITIRIILLFLIIINVLIIINCEDYTYNNWRIFPEGSGMGLFLAVAIPLSLEGNGAYMAYNFEANYALPNNNSHFEYPPIIYRKSKTFMIDRKLVYDAIETKLKSHGYSGRNCILRTICESSLHTIKNINGILGDILHVIITPSTSKNDGLSNVYEEAEMIGKNFKNCTRYMNKYYCNCDDTFINPIVFPYGGPFMGIFVAIAVPLEAPLTNVFVSYNFEANYNLPENSTEYEIVPIVERSLQITRKYIYDAIEFKFHSHGYPGKSCLLRTICEAAEFTLKNDGLLGDIFHIILTPSSSVKENQLSSDYMSAENYGKLKRNCKKFMRKCKFSILELISKIQELH